MNSGKEIALLNVRLVFPTLKCKPPAMQLGVIRQLQWEINSAGPPCVIVGETAAGQGESRLLALAWPGQVRRLCPSPEKGLRACWSVCACD